MHDLFTRGVNAHGHLRPHQSEASDLYKQSELGWIPKEWNVRSLGEIAEFGGGVTLGRDLAGSQVIELPYLRVAKVQDGYLDLSEIKSVLVLKSEVERFSLQKGDMLMTAGAALHGGTSPSGELADHQGLGGSSACPPGDEDGENGSDLLALCHRTERTDAVRARPIE